MKKHTPVRYIDRLLKLNRKLGCIRCGVEDYDPEVAMLLEQAERKISRVTYLINRHGHERAEARKDVDVIEFSPFYENWIDGERKIQ